MGPETINARPSAINFIKRNCWRPLAVLAVVSAALVYNEDSDQNNLQHPKREEPESDGPHAVFSNLPSQEMFDDLVVVSVTINQLLQQPDKQLEINLGQDLQVANSKSVQNFQESTISDGYKLPEKEEVSIASNPQTSEVISQAAAVHSWLAAAGWPQELTPQAEKVIFCESRNIPEKINHAANPNETSYGLFQLVPLWFDYAGEDLENWSDPIVNARVAYQVYLYDINRGQAPWTQWSCKP